MTTKLIPALSLVLVCAAQAALYVDARVSHLEIDGTPNVGDIGRTLDRDDSAAVFSLAVGTKLTDRLRAEVRFTDLGEQNLLKVSPYWAILPPGGEVVLPAQRYYRYRESTRLYSLALPIDVVKRDRFSLVITPVLSVEQSRIEIDDLYLNVQTTGLTVPSPTRFLTDDRTEVRPGGDLTFGYQATEKLRLTFTYTYLSLRAYDAHLLGAGVVLTF